MGSRKLENGRHRRRLQIERSASAPRGPPEGRPTRSAASGHIGRIEDQGDSCGRQACAHALHLFDQAAVLGGRRRWSALRPTTAGRRVQPAAA
jgi:hypothetical protein